MPRSLSKDEQVDLIRCYHETGSYSGALRQYRTENSLRSGPCSVYSLRRLVKRFNKTGSVLDTKKTGRPSVPETNVAEILQMSNELTDENQLGISSSREVARRLDMPVSTVRKVMRKTLGLYPYHLKPVHQLLPQDFRARLDFGLQCAAQIDLYPGWLSRILWTDEAHFYLHGGVNTRYAN